MVKKIVGLSVDELRLMGNLYLPGGGDQGSYPVVCLCHGIPGQESTGEDGGYPALAERITGQGLGAMVFNFRGTGDSDGDLDMLGWTRDLRTALDYLAVVPEVDHDRTYLLGFSAGAAVAITVAAADSRVAGVAACACPAENNFVEEYDTQSIVDYFRSIGLITDRKFPPSTEAWLDGFRRTAAIKHVAKIAPRPLLLVHGSADEVIDVSNAHRLYEAAGEPKQLEIIDGTGHSLRQDERAVTVALDWLKARAGL
ncbi:MAG: alpha/beta fold hydrolase [Chloroflexota bacterium]